ncbi:vascular endothelial growth factor A-like isoform X2 [Myzus persicae]|nr:vascular endothelial growth factor A-like isoform X2 [Myzus persicae]
MELNQVTNVSDLFNKFMPDTNMDEAQRRFITTGFQSRTTLNMERKAAFIPKPASCSIGSQTISLKDTDDRSLYYFPSCTRVDRCGGCCSHDLLACQPTKTETLHFEVLVSQYNGEGKLEFKGRKTVSIDRHLKCKCGCVVKEEDCGPLQTYNIKECRCKCSNEDDEEKCSDEYQLKEWNSATCKCECREIKECTSGYGFDNYTCGCEPIRIRTKNTGGTQLNRNKYSLVVS